MKNNFTTSGLTMTFTSIYDDYNEFINDTRDPIYRTILSAFQKLKNEESVHVNVNACIDNTNFTSEFEFTRFDTSILTNVINPYFEELEDYETCSEIIKIYTDLQ